MENLIFCAVVGPKGPSSAKENKRSRSKHTFDFFILIEEKRLFHLDGTEKGYMSPLKVSLLSATLCILFRFVIRTIYGRL